MKSPFPGMDPYLENPFRWSSVHGGLITATMAELNTRLPPRYVAGMGERITIIDPERGIYPDVFVAEESPAFKPARGRSPKERLLEADAPLLLQVEMEELRETYIEILSLPDEGRIVTALEILSPGNKTAGSD